MSRMSGRYEHLGNAWFSAYQTQQARKRAVSKKRLSFEIYEGGPQETAPEELVTQVYLPVKG